MKIGFISHKSVFLLLVFLSLSFLSCDEKTKKNKTLKQANPSTETPTDTETIEDGEPTDTSTDSNTNTSTTIIPIDDIRKKYTGFNKEIWVDFKDKYFRPDGQHVDRWQKVGGPEIWHIPDGTLLQSMLLGAYAMEYQWSGKSQESLDKLNSIKKGLDVLEEVTGIPGLFARVAIKKDGRTPPEWVWMEGTYLESTTKTDYIYRADVSGDQYSGLAWGLAHAVVFGPDDIKDWAIAMSKRIVKYIAANDWELKRDGQLIEHGDMGPMDPVDLKVLVALAGGNGMHIAKILTFLTIANMKDPDPDIEKIASDFKAEWYGKGGTFVGCGQMKKSDNVFQVSSCFQAYLVVNPDDKTYQDKYSNFITSCNYAEGIPFDDFAMLYLIKNLTSEQKAKLRESGINALKQFPYPKIIKNAPQDRFAPYGGDDPLPVYQRVINSWTWGENPYVLGQEPTAGAKAGDERMSPLDYITVYSMGRAYGIYTEQNP